MNPQTVMTPRLIDCEWRKFLATRTPTEQLSAGRSFLALDLCAYLQHHSGASLSETAAALGISGCRASQLVDLLHRRQLLSRAPDPADRRRIRLQLTAATLNWFCEQRQLPR